jgi:hypothetical protein
MSRLRAKVAVRATVEVRVKEEAGTEVDHKGAGKMGARLG